MINEQHYEAEQLIDYVEGRLDPSSTAELLKHLEGGCPFCNASKTFYERLFAAIQTLHWQAPTPSIQKRVVSQFSLYYPKKTKPQPRFQPLLRPVLIGLSIMAMVVFVFLFTLNPGVVYAGYVENVSGQVELLDPSTGSWTQVSQGQSLPINATIRTFSDAHVTIAFPGGEKTILASESEVRLDSIVMTQGFWEISLEQISGQTDNQTSSSTSSFSIKTNAGVVNSNKAHFMMEIDADGSVTTDVFEGDVKTLSHSEKSTIHSGQTLVFPSNKFTTMGTPFYRDTAVVPSSTPVSMDKTTKTPNSNGNLEHTPAPKIDPTQRDNPGLSGSSDNTDNSCNPGNSNGNGNSGYANNSTEACN